jgi:hypothetical protein
MALFAAACDCSALSLRLVVSWPSADSQTIRRDSGWRRGGRTPRPRAISNPDKPGHKRDGPSFLSRAGQTGRLFALPARLYRRAGRVSLNISEMRSCLRKVSLRSAATVTSAGVVFDPVSARSWVGLYAVMAVMVTSGSVGFGSVILVRRLLASCCSASTPPTRRTRAVRSGKMPTTSVRRRISRFSRP